jgi:hypothetical protein
MFPSRDTRRVFISSSLRPFALHNGLDASAWGALPNPHHCILASATPHALGRESGERHHTLASPLMRAVMPIESITALPCVCVCA